MTVAHALDAGHPPSSSDEVGHHQRLVETVGSIPDLAGKPFVSRLLPGGLTNGNYCLRFHNGRRLTLRLSSPQSSQLGINRDHEHANSAAAAASGVAPAVVAYLPQSRALAFEWIDGRTFTPQDLTGPATLERVAALCRKLHAGPRFTNDFDMFAVMHRYLQIVEDAGYRRPADYPDHLPMVQQVQAAMTVRAEPPVPWHNDLLPGNIMADDQRLWFIDFEYAGNGDPCFDLGNLCSEATLDDDRLEHLVGAYYGQPTAGAIARTKLFALMSDYGWTLWACIQAATSQLHFDFWGWGLAKYERALAILGSPQLTRLIADVQKP